MRLLRVRIDRFWGERELRLDIASRRGEDVGLLFLVGPNGSGKSRLLENLGRIFRQLTAQEPVGLDFDLEYELDFRRVLVTTRAPRLASGEVTAAPRVAAIGAWLLTAGIAETTHWSGEHDAGWTAEHVHNLPPDPATWLPARVIGVSTGPTSRLAGALELLKDMAGAALSENVEEAQLATDTARATLGETRCLALSGAELALAPMALLAHPSTATQPDAVRDGLLKRVGVDPHRGLIAFAIDVSRDWRSLASVDASMLERFLNRADPIVEIPSAPTVDGDPEEPDLRAVFELTSKTQAWLGEFIGSALNLFERLLVWQRQGAIVKVRIVLHKADRDGLIGADELSDGEFLLLGRYSLMLLLRGLGGSLVLLDEPETHFNDRWKVELVGQLVEILRIGPQRDEVLIATHSDLTLTDAERDEVYLFDNDHVHASGDSPLAADRDAIATSLFAVDSPVGQHGIAKIDKAIESGPAEIRQLLTRVGPGFHRFRLEYALRNANGDVT